MSVRALPADVEKAFLARAAEGRAFWKAGDVVSAEAAFLDAWQLIPEPRLGYDYAQSFARGLVDFFRDTRQFEKANEWLVVTRQAYRDPDDPTIDFLGATVAFAAGNHQEAFRLFDKVHSAYGLRPFRGEDPAYLKFFRAYSK